MNNKNNMRKTLRNLMVGAGILGTTMMGSTAFANEVDMRVLH